MKNLILLTLLASLVYGAPIVGTLGKPEKLFKKIVTKEKVYYTNEYAWSTGECLVLTALDGVVVCDIETIEDLPTLEIK